ncbi:MAG TPA: DUF2752 domain-containing protein [Acidimicrobiales bacterium]|nr:DUF2752 domain-containing protein [Acidimicrobiales bacterium]
MHVPLCPFHAMTGLYCPLCGSLRGVGDLAHGHVMAALGSNLLLVVTLPLMAWGALSLAGVAEVRGPWTVRSQTWIALGVVALAYTVVRNMPFGAALAP